ncbi:hypothetical protein NBRC116494_06370 [Aurantivibrio plasticivorans]
MVVDDLSEIRGSIKRMLKVFGVEDVDTAANGEEAVELCTSKSYDIVLCDYNLGKGKDGQQILEELRFRKLLKNTSLYIMITAESSRDMVLGALEYQPDDYVTKPITQSSLRTRLDKALIRHEALYGIKQAIDKKNYKKAAELSEAVEKTEPRYEMMCKSMRGELYQLLEEYDKARSLYDSVLDDSDAVWAKLGLGKTLIALREFGDAEEVLKEVLEVDNRYVEAHDLLAVCYNEQADGIRAQAEMKKAVEVSPKSVLRQRRLAALALKNQDIPTSLKASRSTVKLGQNSCYESPTDYFNLAGRLADTIKENGNSNSQNSKEAFEILQKVEQRYPRDKSILLQSASVKSRVHSARKELADAEKWEDTAREIYFDIEDEVGVEASLEYAHTLMNSGDDVAARKIMERIVKEDPNNVELAEQIDSLSDEPVSKRGKKQVSELTKRGIACYEGKDYEEAIHIFKNAVALYPKHVGLNLNLVQVILAECESNGAQRQYRAICRKCLSSVDGLSESSPQFERFNYLKRQAQQCFPEHAA